VSAFAGVFFRTPGGERDHWQARVRAAVHAHAENRTVAEIRAGNAIVWKFDANAYSSPGLLDSPTTGLTVVAGHPHGATVRSKKRVDHVRWLHESLQGKDDPPGRLGDARGSYAFAHLTSRGERLVLGTDCLGVRPVYYFVGDECVIFSTQLRTFENLKGVALTLDPRGAIEMATFGFCCGERTRYAQIKSIRPGRIVSFSWKEVSDACYWRWDDPSSYPALGQGEAIRLVFTAFQDAVESRLEDDASVQAFLTGGLDSRAVVAALRQRNVTVNSLNFAPEGSLDLVFGAQASAALQTRHLELPRPSAPIAGSITSVMPSWIAHLSGQGWLPARPRLVWSGDGGSVALGHVYLTEAMVGLAERESVEEALRLMLHQNSWRVPKGILPSERADELAEFPYLGLREELEQIHHPDAGRRLHVMLMLTDQRGHLHAHYERIYEHATELQLPFFDRVFLQSILAQPARPFLAHRFYNEWLKLFAAEVTSVPWQAYPGHVPCPIPLPQGLSYQWASRPRANAVERRERRRLCKSVAAGIRRGCYENGMIDRLRLAFACVATLMGIRNYAYALKFAEALGTPQASNS
jgi:hypothetical protein